MKRCAIDRDLGFFHALAFLYICASVYSVSCLVSENITSNISSPPIFAKENIYKTGKLCRCCARKTVENLTLEKGKKI